MDATVHLAEEVACVIEELLSELSQDKSFSATPHSEVASHFHSSHKRSRELQLSCRAARHSCAVCEEVLILSAGCDRADLFEGWRRESFSLTVCSIATNARPRNPSGFPEGTQAGLSSALMFTRLGVMVVWLVVGTEMIRSESGMSRTSPAWCSSRATS